MIYNFFFPWLKSGTDREQEKNNPKLVDPPQLVTEPKKDPVLIKTEVSSMRETAEVTKCGSCQHIPICKCGESCGCRAGEPSEGPGLPPRSWWNHTYQLARYYYKDVSDDRLRRTVGGIWLKMSEENRRKIWARAEERAAKHKPKKESHEQTP